MFPFMSVPTYALGLMVFMTWVVWAFLVVAFPRTREDLKGLPKGLALATVIVLALVAIIVVLRNMGYRV